MSYKVLVIGDIHFGKSFKSYKRNPYSESKEVSLTELWRNCTVSYLLKVAQSLEKEKVDEVIFLGDLVDKPRVEPIDANYTKFVVKAFEEVSEKVSIIVGNHDTVEPQNPQGSILPILSSSKVDVYSSYYISEEKGFIYLPYYKKGVLVDTLKEIAGLLKRDPSSYTIFSHNDIYINSSFIATEMLSDSTLRELFGGFQIGIVNGHIHNYYAEPSQKIVFPGSVSPTSFKDDPLASGICLIEIGRGGETFRKYTRYKNDEIIFLTIDKEVFIEKLEDYLDKIRPYSPVVVLRFPSTLLKGIEPTLKKYSDLIHFYKVKTKRDEDLERAEIIPTRKLIEDGKVDKEFFSKVKEKVEKGLTLHEVKSMFLDFLAKKYPTLEYKEKLIDKSQRQN